MYVQHEYFTYRFDHSPESITIHSPDYILLALISGVASARHKRNTTFDKFPGPPSDGQRPRLWICVCTIGLLDAWLIDNGFIATGRPHIRLQTSLMGSHGQPTKERYISVIVLRFSCEAMKQYNSVALGAS